MDLDVAEFSGLSISRARASAVAARPEVASALSAMAIWVRSRFTAATTEWSPVPRGAALALGLGLAALRFVGCRRPVAAAVLGSGVAAVRRVGVIVA